jgi:hypothetical protein
MIRILTDCLQFLQKQQRGVFDVVRVIIFVENESCEEEHKKTNVMNVFIHKSIKTNADTENRTQVADLQDQSNSHYTIPAYYTLGCL